MNWIEICKAGTWTAKNGKQVTLTTDDLDNIVRSYNPKEREAPLVFGHPEDNQPAFGWVDKLKRAGDILSARFKQIPEAVKSLVKAGHYKKVSISLGSDKKRLRHVGLLGAVQPAVPGLANVKFSDPDVGLTIDFSNHTHNTTKEEIMEKKELEAKLAAEEAARKKAETELAAATKKAEDAENELSAAKQKTFESRIEARVDKLVGKKIKAADSEVVKKLALALGDSGEIELSKGAGKKKPVEHLFDFLSGLNDLGILSEFSAPGKDGDDTGLDSSGMMDRV